MAVNQYLGEIKMAGFNFAPTGWALAQGQIMSIQQNTALFALLGTMYGGNGQTNFGLPDLRGRAGGQVGPNLFTSQGELLGVESVTINSQQYPAHSHPLNVNNGAGTATAPAGNYMAAFVPAAPPPPPRPPGNVFTAAQGAQLQPLNPLAVSMLNGADLPHDNMMPYLVMNYIISLTGIFPPRG
jgi:microcystin-dependent protein